MKLACSALLKFTVGLLLVGALLFLLSGSFSYGNGWLFLSIPLVLGSWWAFLCFLPYLAVIVLRIRNEETVLEAGLAGDTDDKKRVRYRLLPWIR